MFTIPMALASPIVTLLVLVIGLGVMWGVLKTSVKHISKAVDRLDVNLGANEKALTELRMQFMVHVAEQTAPAQKRRKRSHP